MITVGGRNELAPHIMSSMYEFRHEIFVGRLGWSLPLLDGVERDQYDDEQAVYFVDRDTGGNITACARLLPTTTSYMMPDLFSALLGDQPAPRDPAVWELSRFATSVRKTHEGRILSLSQPTLDLLEAVIEFARQHAAQRLLLATSIASERLLLRAGLDVHRVAAPVHMPDGLFVALYIEVPPGSAAAGRDVGRLFSSLAPVRRADSMPSRAPPPGSCLTRPASG